MKNVEFEIYFELREKVFNNIKFDASEDVWVSIGSIHSDINSRLNILNNVHKCVPATATA